MREKENLFDFGEAEMESGVDPSQDLRSTDEVSGIHHTNIRRHSWFLCFSQTPEFIDRQKKKKIQTASGVWRERERESCEFKKKRRAGFIGVQNMMWCRNRVVLCPFKTLGLYIVWLGLKWASLGWTFIMDSSLIMKY